MDLPHCLWIIFIILTTARTDSLLFPLYRRNTREDILGAVLTGLDANNLRFSHNLSGLPGRGYYLTVGLGTPAQPISLLLDTGSSDLAVAGQKLPNVDRWFHKNLSATLQPSAYEQHVRYQRGSWSGQLCSDVLRFPSAVAFRSNESAVNKTDLRAHFALIYKARDFFVPHNGSSWEGIAGLGFHSLSVFPTPLGQKPVKPARGFIHSGWEYVKGLLSPSVARPHGLFDDLVNYWKVPDVFSLLLCGSAELGQPQTQPTNLSSPRAGGLFLAGSGNMSSAFPGQLLTSGSVYYTPVRQKWYYEIVMIDILVQAESVISECKELNFDKTIVDSGTTNIHLPGRVFSPLLSSIQGYVSAQVRANNLDLVLTEGFWLGKSLFCEPAEEGTTIGGRAGLPYVLFPPVEFQLQSSANTVLSVILSPQQYLRYIGRIANSNTRRDCFAFGIQSTRLGSVLGSVFLEGYFTVFDRARLQVGFANSTCNRYSSVSQLPVSQVNGIRKTWRTDLSECAFHRPVTPPLIERVLAISLFVSLFSMVVPLFFAPIFCILSNFTEDFDKAD
ncbi:unnamed protein product [Calicophoron daubneyi]|uniref:Peptidase A1 domain-containing protein n=1 Tax=Calicophoron daubneyi TaxID=300641 RepID=A0AAV2U2L7_CALDB